MLRTISTCCTHAAIFVHRTDSYFATSKIMCHWWQLGWQGFGILATLEDLMMVLVAHLTFSRLGSLKCAQHFRIQFSYPELLVTQTNNKISLVILKFVVLKYFKSKQLAIDWVFFKLLFIQMKFTVTKVSQHCWPIPNAIDFHAFRQLQDYFI